MTAAAAAPSLHLDRAWFDRSAPVLARDLLGCRLVHDAPDGPIGGRIVETEAYRGPEDRAAHSWRGPTQRNAVMFGAPGHLYVYLVYGLHHCVNVVAGPGTKPEAVLIRALALDEGIERARASRGDVPEWRLASGPGNVGKALGVDRSLNGADLLRGPVRIESRTGAVPRVAHGPRVGIDYAGAWAARPWRFWIADDPHRSRA